MAIRITAVFFDFIGTTILEKNNDVVLSCFQNAFDDFGVKVDKQTLQEHRGKRKDIMIADILKLSKKDPRKYPHIFTTFKKHLTKRIDELYENEDLDATMAHL